MKKILQKTAYILSRSSTLSRVAKKIVDYHRNENNCEITTNGEFDFIQKNKNNFKVIFDVGANVGEWTAIVSELIPEAKVYSFEPSIETFKVLSKQTFNTNVNLHNIGLGERNESVNFFIYDNDSTLNSVFNRDTQNMRSEKAHFETLDSFCALQNIERISFLKIDTEGNELSVLKGAEVYLTAGKIDAIQFEYGGTYIDARITLKEVFTFFNNKPYTLYKMLRNGLQECPTYVADLENYQYSNYIAKRTN